MIIDTHGKDLQVSAEPSRVSTPAPSAQASSSSGPSKPAPKVVKKEEKPLNTSTVTVDATFMASADDLFSLLTDQNRIPMWTRNPAEVSSDSGILVTLHRSCLTGGQSKPVPEGSYSLFGGGVTGTYVSLDRPQKFVQKWALNNPKWPSGEYAILQVVSQR